MEVLENKKVKVPKLRFREFEDGWKSFCLGEVTSYIKGFAFSSEDYQANGTRIIRVSDITKDGIRSENEKVFVSDAKVKEVEKYLIRKGNIIVTTVGSPQHLEESAVGRGIFVSNENIGLLNQNMLKFENISNFENGFLMGYLNSKRYRNYVNSISRGNANQANITVVELLQYKLFVPSLPEQKKIAGFLSAVDEKLMHLGRKKELLQQYKKGVMQKLFSQELRFKGENGSDYEDWEEKRLGEVARLYQPTTITQADLTDNGYPVYGANGIVGYYDKFNHETEQVAVTCRGSTCGVVNYTMPMSWITGNAMVLNVDQFPNVEKRFLYYQMVHTDLRYLITGSGQPQITGTLNTHLVLLPCLEEQQKIAAFLSSLDRKIDAVNAQIELTQQFKKGLLQEMFV